MGGGALHGDRPSSLRHFVAPRFLRAFSAGAFFRRTYGSQTVEKREAASPPDSAEPTTGSVGAKYL
jgi:hypothetical protein